MTGANAEGIVGTQVLSEHDTAQFPLGTRMKVDGTSYIYIQADEAIAQYAWCKMQTDFGVIELATSDVDDSGAAPTDVVVPQIALTSLYYGWAVEGPGVFTGLSEDDIAADKKIYTTSTPGKVDDDSSSTVLIAGVYSGAAITGATSASFKATRKMGCNT